MQTTLFDPTSVNSDNRLSLRPYQEEGLAAIRKSLATHDSTLLQNATGLGKTVVFTELAATWPGRTLVICPFTELINQAAGKIRDRTGVDPAIERAELWSDERYSKSKYVVGSKDTLTARFGGGKRYHRFTDISLVVADECHLSATQLWADMIGHFVDHGAKVLGVTATVKRHDGRAMSQLYAECCYRYGIHQAILDGWLVRPMAKTVQLQSLDVSDVLVGNTRFGRDFNQKQLSEKMGDYKTVCEIVDVTARETRGKKTVIYCQSVDQARKVSERLEDSYGIPSAWICADVQKCSKDQRRAAIKSFKDTGGVTHLCNVTILAIGFDFPGIEALVMARVTRSTPLYVQILGRATRPLPGVVDPHATAEPQARLDAIAASAKPHFLLVDLVANSDNHKIVTAADVMGGRHSLVGEVVDRVKVAAEGGKSVDVCQLLIDEGRNLEEERKKREEQHRRERARGIKAKATYQTTDVDLFTGVSAGQYKKTRGRVHIPFGKHVGEKISSLPSQYLRWLAGLCGEPGARQKWLKEAADSELRYRTLTGDHK